jgi:hypothetical protein
MIRPLTVLRTDSTADLALLGIDGPAQDRPLLRLASEPPQVGADVFAGLAQADTGRH